MQIELIDKITNEQKERALVEHARKLDRESDMKKDNNNRQAFDYSIAYECLLWQKRISFIFPFPLSI